MKEISRLSLFLMFLIFGISLSSLSGLSVFPFSLIPSTMDFIYRVGLSIIFLFSVIFSVKNKCLKKYWGFYSLLYCLFYH